MISHYWELSKAEALIGQPRQGALASLSIETDGLPSGGLVGHDIINSSIAGESGLDRRQPPNRLGLAVSL
jgi:hypothetical protein